VIDKIRYTWCRVTKWIMSRRVNKGITLGDEGQNKIHYIQCRETTWIIGMGLKEGIKLRDER
jgi:hypothetical protein